jgi:hypothetical protein
MQAYTAKLKTRKQMERDIPRERLGWWHDVCAGQTLRNLRDATESDLQRCFLRDGSSKNPADYLCENFDGGCLVSHEAVATLTPNAKLTGLAPEGDKS